MSFSNFVGESVMAMAIVSLALGGLWIIIDTIARILTKWREKKLANNVDTKIIDPSKFGLPAHVDKHCMPQKRFDKICEIFTLQLNQKDIVGAASSIISAILRDTPKEDMYQGDERKLLVLLELLDYSASGKNPELDIPRLMSAYKFMDIFEEYKDFIKEKPHTIQEENADE